MSETTYHIRDIGYVAGIILLVLGLMARCTALDLAEIRAAQACAAWEEHPEAPELTQGLRMWM